MSRYNRHDWWSKRGRPLLDNGCTLVTRSIWAKPNTALFRCLFALFFRKLVVADCFCCTLHQSSFLVWYCRVWPCHVKIIQRCILLWQKKTEQPKDDAGTKSGIVLIASYLAVSQEPEKWIPLHCSVPVSHLLYMDSHI